MAETPNNKKSKFWTIVLNAPKEKVPSNEARDFLTAILSQLNDTTIYPFIASIIHDRDTTLNGELKTIHAHAFIETPTQPTKRALLEELGELLSIDTDLITIEATNSDFLQVQYLIHKNDKLKTQYEAIEIKTNNENELQKRLSKEYQSKDPAKAIFTSPTLTALIENIGLELANKYRNTFNQVKQDQQKTTNEQTYRMKLQELLYLIDVLQININQLLEGCELATTEEIRNKIKLDTLRNEIEQVFKSIRELDTRSFLDTIK